MTAEEISERLKAIGPYVRHDTHDFGGTTIHAWVIGSAPHGLDAARATLASPSLEWFDDADWDELIAHGKERYLAKGHDKA